ncbi:hypothetical protein BS47DRAFT_1377843 [Hydnum rufescens UP504]|uniref:Peptidase A2 domain-containing protein n=1 Tax=Hydnum rufescens UP504 TaxID=1448309 RepID=A0A9P6DRP6_9AGAM|nr:hypothetical protein BS47DRAFT_1377843 [Hydnum rufescens UP504]
MGTKWRAALERNTACPKDISRVAINGHTCQVLIDTGSLVDFISTTCADQLKLPVENLLAVTGSQSLIHHETRVLLELQDSYDIVLGTPFLYQHSVTLGSNPSHFVIGNTDPLPLRGQDISVIPSCRATIIKENIETLQQQLRTECADLCKAVEETPLPPLHNINHSIPLIDETKVYKSRRSTCPEALRPLWNKKWDAMINTGHWEYHVGPNAALMLIVKKKPGPNGEVRIRTVIDK